MASTFDPQDFDDWLLELSDGDTSRIAEAYAAYFQRLRRFAAKKLSDFPTRDIDEEDIANSVMKSLHRGFQAGRFGEVNDEAALWRLLLSMAARKVAEKQRRRLASKRGGGTVRGESVFERDEEGLGLSAVLGREPSAELSYEFADEVSHIVDRLSDSQAQQVLFLRLDGLTVEEVAVQLAISSRTVERKLAKIRSCIADRQ